MMGRLLGPHYGIIGGKSLSQRHNDTLPSSGTEPRVNNRVGILAFNVSSETQQRILPSVGIKLAALRLLFGVVTDRATPPSQIRENQCSTGNEKN